MNDWWSTSWYAAVNLGANVLGLFAVVAVSYYWLSDHRQFVKREFRGANMSLGFLDGDVFKIRVVSVYADLAHLLRTENRVFVQALADAITVARRRPEASVLHLAHDGHVGVVRERLREIASAAWGPLYRPGVAEVKCVVALVYGSQSADMLRQVHVLVTPIDDVHRLGQQVPDWRCQADTPQYRARVRLLAALGRQLKGDHVPDDGSLADAAVTSVYLPLGVFGFPPASAAPPAAS